MTRKKFQAMLNRMWRKYYKAYIMPDCNAAFLDAVNDAGGGSLSRNNLFHVVNGEPPAYAFDDPSLVEPLKAIGGHPLQTGSVLVFPRKVVNKLADGKLLAEPDKE